MTDIPCVFDCVGITFLPHIVVFCRSCIEDTEFNICRYFPGFPVVACLNSDLAHIYHVFTDK